MLKKSKVNTKMRTIKALMLSALLCLFGNHAHAAYSVTATIANGASLSSLVDLSSFIDVGSPRPAAIVIPSSWTAANLTVFICNPTGSSCQELYDGAGNEYQVVVTAANTYILLDQSVFNAVLYLKLQSGTSGSPVNQGGARTISVVLY